LRGNLKFVSEARQEEAGATGATRNPAETGNAEGIRGEGKPERRSPARPKGRGRWRKPSESDAGSANGSGKGQPGTEIQAEREDQGMRPTRSLIGRLESRWMIRSATGLPLENARGRKVSGVFVLGGFAFPPKQSLDGAPSLCGDVGIVVSHPSRVCFLVDA
jgi:hypothetical protein